MKTGVNRGELNILNQKTGNRELAYIVKVLETKELPNYTNVHYIRVLEWWCVAPKDIKLGDLVVYFEIDSKLPANDARFAFMEKRKFLVKTQKICKVVSQGLILSLSEFPELKGCKEGDFSEPLVFESCDYGFRFGNPPINMFFVTCYSIQNGYYPNELDILYDGKEVIHGIICPVAS